MQSSMIDYLTCPMWLKYDLTILPEKQGFGGGMPVKTQRVLEVLGRRYFVRGISEVSEATAPLMVIEPLYFNMLEDHEDPYQKLSELKAHPAKKLLYCSEMGLLRMDPPLRNGILSCVDAITCNCLYQAEMFKYIGVRPDSILTDPIPCHIFKPSENRTQRVIATGNVSWQKNVAYLVEIFSELQELGVETCYIGSASLWGRTSDVENLRLERELKQVADHYHPSLTQAETAEVMRECTAGLWVAWHETFGMGLAELMACGLHCWMFPHGLREERPGLDFNTKTAIEGALAIAEKLDNPPECLSSTSRTWALKNVSYEAFLTQFEGIIGRIHF